MAAGKPPPPKPVNGERKRNERIGDQLRKYYDDVAKEPIPEEFLNLLKAADENFDDEAGKDD
jgi:hypothetical protein